MDKDKVSTDVKKSLHANKQKGGVPSNSLTHEYKLQDNCKSDKNNIVQKVMKYKLIILTLIVVAILIYLGPSLYNKIIGKSKSNHNMMYQPMYPHNMHNATQYNQQMMYDQGNTEMMNTGNLGNMPNMMYQRPGMPKVMQNNGNQNTIPNSYPVNYNNEMKKGFPPNLNIQKPNPLMQTSIEADKTNLEKIDEEDDDNES